MFSVFENKLTSEGIDNKYYLQGILRELFGNEFVYKRDYILKDNNEASFYSEIVNYIRKQRYPISQKEIVGEFPGITDIIVSFAVSDPEIINLFGKYIHISSLNISNEYKSVLFASIKDLLCDKKTHHAKELFDTINLQRPDIWRNLFIEFPFGAFSLFEALFGDEFEFKRPYVARKGVTIEHAYERLAEYVNSKEIVEVAEIMDFARENNLLVYSILDLLDSLNDSHLIIDKENISKIDYIGVREDTANILEGHILYELGENDMMPISLFSSTHKLPELDIEWTEWLLYSVIKKWGKEIEVTVTSNQFRSASPVAVRRGKLNEVNIESFVNNDSMTLKKVDDLSNIDELIEDVIEIDLG